MFSDMQSGPYQQLLMRIMGGGGGAQGFTQPGQQPASGAPTLPQPGARGASTGMPTMPSAFGANGQMNGPPGQSGGPGGMMGSLGNPMAMQSIMKMMGSGASPGMQPGVLGGQVQPPMNQGQPLPSQAGAMNIPSQQGGIMALLQHMFSGGGGS